MHPVLATNPPCLLSSPFWKLARTKALGGRSSGDIYGAAGSPVTANQSTSGVRVTYRRFLSAAISRQVSK